MSLINNMLQGLERRREETGSDAFDPLLGELSAVDHEELTARERARGLGLWAVFFLVLLVLLFSVFSINLQKDRNSPEPETVLHEGIPGGSSDNMVLSNTAIAPKSINIPAAESDPHGPGVSLKLDSAMELPAGDALVKRNREGPVPVDDISMDGDGNELNLSLSLPVKAKYLMYTLPNPHRVILELSNARYDGALPDIGRLDGIHAIRQRMEEDGTYKLVLESEREILIDNAQMKHGDAGYVLQIDMAYAEEAESMAVSMDDVPDEKAPEREQAGTFSKSPAGKKDQTKTDEVTKTASPVDVLVYEGRKLYQEGNIREGIGRIIEAVQRDPEHAGARKSLAVLLLEQNRRAEAKELLVEGLRISPGQSDWARTLARILYDEGNLKQARAVLEGAVPPLRANLDYHALYAGILQSMEEHARAAMVYRNLLKYGGNNGSWWLGLAISLEAMARKNDAIIAYRNALNTPEIKADSEQFIKNRLRNLNQRS
ncbi:MAG: tetratricopeptide repeat protein [Gammaproteobacteria bacterium]